MKTKILNDVKPSDESNEVQGTVQHLDQANPVSNQLPKDCYPKDQLSPEELLPGNEIVNGLKQIQKAKVNWC